MLSTPKRLNETNSYKTFSKTQLKKFPEVETWLKNISDKSHPVYLRALQRFCNWHGKNPRELIIQRDQELHHDNPNERHHTRDLILDFRHHLEHSGLAPKTISSHDGAIRGFYTAVLGRRGMINIRNYWDKNVTKKQDLVPTLEELKKMIEVMNLEKGFRILFLAQTGMRVSDAINLNLGDIQRELDLEKIPLAIRFLPKKDREHIGERVTFLGSDGVMMLKRYLAWREKRGEVLSSESVLFSSRNRKSGSISSRNFNETIREAARRAGIGNGNEKYGRVRVHCLRKFFITQMTNHGMEDKIVNFLTCHKISEVDSVYWNRRVDTLRRLYADRQQFLNPLHGEKNCFDLKKMNGIIGKIKSLEERIDHLTNKDFLGELVREVLKDKGFFDDDVEKYESVIVSGKKDVIRLSDLGFSCQPLGDGMWLMRKKVRG
ncbi:MAG: site-specific integrase [Candidatus Thermoplasmatota archaeon]|nr:site-specific integrase [Candidatus Thermoplasmatota archaeon]